jgi:nicotinate-nucleotide--dimethylbenzimidazole phosphoribosyltransferase
VFCRQNGIDTVFVDAGVAWTGDKPEGMVDHWMGAGTSSSLTGDAMTAEQVEQCYAAGAAVVDQSTDPACTIMGFGELGIGNTSASSLIAAALTGISLEDCVGPGSGLVGDGLNRKLQLLSQVWERHPRTSDPRRVMAMYGGFEIAQMTGAMRRAYELGRIIMIDGFVATAAFLATWAEDPSIIDNAIFCHESGEPGHHRVLEHLGVKALLNLGMRLGEGTGCAVAYPIIVSAATFLNDMADFEQAGVSTGEPEAAAA